MHSIYLVIVFFASGNSVSELLLRTSKNKSLKSLRFSLAGNKASVLDEPCTYYFPYLFYSM
jgi:hypothetical protein